VERRKRNETSNGYVRTEIGTSDETRFWLDIDAFTIASMGKQTKR
jgi:hypothetical protein